MQPTCTCECIWLKTLIIESRQTSKHSCEAKQEGSCSAGASSRETTDHLLTTPFYHGHYYTICCRGYWSPHGSRTSAALSFDYVVDPPPGRSTSRHGVHGEDFLPWKRARAGPSDSARAQLGHSRLSARGAGLLQPPGAHEAVQKARRSWCELILSRINAFYISIKK